MNEWIDWKIFFKIFFQLFVQVIQSRVDRRYFDCGLSNFLSHLNQFIWWTQTFEVDWNWFNWSNIAKTLYDKFTKYSINEFFSINKTFFLFFHFISSFVRLIINSIHSNAIQCNIKYYLLFHFIIIIITLSFYLWLKKSLPLLLHLRIVVIIKVFMFVWKNYVVSS